ncbi:MAG TPA: M67 family metallopeptidase [Actinomycetes bacterium]|jgi:proteasome lid subunit RPN8/RPN11|nr:M67 family metallopeptidase [Actinomycetes bacterium]
MLAIDQDGYQALVAHARAELPNEACALLAGGDRVERIFPVPNAEASPTMYVIDPRDYLRAEEEWDRHGWELKAVFHSHVATDAYPSRTDVGLALPGVTYLILSLADPDTPLLRGFRIQDGHVSEEPVRVLADGGRVPG